jgi:phosphoserine aminotransferase
MRVSNFNAGPAGLPLSVLERAQGELLDYAGTGMSIMEHSHRGKTYEAVHDEAIALLRELAGIPDTHHVLFLQGGASLQFAMLPMNFLGPGNDKSADYVNTGHWSERAIDEARYYGKPRIAATTAGDRFTRVPRSEELDLDPGAAYVHITTNNTIEGTQWFAEPDTRGVPLVGDMSSDFLWRKPDIARYGMIYAGAQKNLGPSGVVLVVARKDFVDRARTDIPTIFRYSTFAKNNSLYNTPPTFAIYLVRNVLLWIKDMGGPEKLEARNREKAALVYGAIDESGGYYRAPVARESRSVMNIVFRLPSEALELKGHRSVGGIRASTYNAVSVEDCAKLASFMRTFAEKNPG